MRMDGGADRNARAERKKERAIQAKEKHLHMTAIMKGRPLFVLSERERERMGDAVMTGGETRQGKRKGDCLPVEV